MDATDILLKVDNVTLTYGANTVLNDVCFTIGRNETLGLVGESGSGKSQTALAIMRLLPSTAIFNSGKIQWVDNNKDILKQTEKEMQAFRGKQAAMIFQDPQTALNPVLTCGHQVAEALLIHNKISKSDARKQTLALFAEVQLPEPERMYRSYPHQLSGGQKQRVMIAMAVSCKPRLLIADEPTTALDVTVQASVLELLKKLKQQQGMSMLFISHDLAVVGQVSDRVAVIYRGKIVECNTTHNIFHNPQHPYTQALIACRPSARLALRRLPVMEKGDTNNLEDWQITPSVELSNVDITQRHKQLYDTAQPILSINNLTTHYATRRNIWGLTTQWLNAVDNVTIDVFKGETLGIVGESGSGKSTLGRTLMRLVNAASGTISYRGKRIDTMEGRALRYFRRTLQIIFQDSYAALDPLISAGEAVAEPLRIHKLCKDKSGLNKRVTELFNQVGLHAELLKRLPHQLSGGQRQRVCIARALALEPEIIICDESVSSLDVSLQAQVLNLLADLRDQKQLTYIFISHDLNVISHFCDRVIVMQQGKIVESGYPADIIKHPTQVYTQKLVEAIPMMPL